MSAENTTSAANTSTTDAQALNARNQTLEGENALLTRQLADLRTLIEQDRESREADKASI